MQRTINHKHPANNSSSLFASNSGKESSINSRSELIPIIQKNNEQLVDARQLHEFLKVKSNFNDWFRNRLSDFCFKESVDYIVSKILVAKTQRSDYYLTLDMAKELAMIERNDQGRQIRQYFIACEKKLRQVAQTNSIMYIDEMVYATIDKVETVKINKRELYHYRQVQKQLGYSTKSSLDHVRRNYGTQLVVLDGKSFVSFEYVELMVTRTITRQTSQTTKLAAPVLPLNFPTN